MLNGCTILATRQRQIGQHAILAEPLIRRTEMRQFGPEVGHHTQLIVRIMLAAQADLMAHPGFPTIRSNQQFAAQYLTALQRQHG